MKTTHCLKGLFLTVILILLGSCSAEDGEDGAIGPQGPQGEQGVAGPAGSQGEQGETGTANVIYSDWTATELSDNILTSSDFFIIDAPQIDANMLNLGTILVYGKRVDITDGDVVYQLPIVFGGARQQSYFFRAQLEEIRISVHANEEGESVGDGTFLEQYRYILIPGGVSTSGKSANLDYSKMSYGEITAHFGIAQ